MKLRLETGNFKIVGTVDESESTPVIDINNLPKGLSEEDFLGCVVDLGGNGHCVVTMTQKVPSNENLVMFMVNAFAFTYNRSTGEVTLSEGGSEG